MLVTYTPSPSGTAITLAGSATDCSDDVQGFAAAYRDADSVEDIVGAARPETFRRGNRAVSASFRTTWLYATVDAAQTAALGLLDEFRDRGRHVQRLDCNHQAHPDGGVGVNVH